MPLQRKIPLLNFNLELNFQFSRQYLSVKILKMLHNSYSDYSRPRKDTRTIINLSSNVGYGIGKCLQAVHYFPESQNSFHILPSHNMVSKRF